MHFLTISYVSEKNYLLKYDDIFHFAVVFVRSVVVSDETVFGSRLQSLHPPILLSNIPSFPKQVKPSHLAV